MNRIIICGLVLCWFACQQKEEVVFTMLKVGENKYLNIFDQSSLQLFKDSVYTTKIGELTFAQSNNIRFYGAHDLIIQGKWIKGIDQPGISLINCNNIHITKNFISDGKEVGIYLFDCNNIKIDSNYISNVSTGVYVVNVSKGSIQVNNNQFKNMQGPFPRGAFIQFDNVNGPENSIIGNKGENIFGKSYPEDAINLYKSNGTSASPIVVLENWILGGGPSVSGGGIMLGDNGGSYQVAQNNTLVNPGQYGMAISGGDHITINRNKVYSAGKPFNNVGIYIWGQKGKSITNATVCNNKVKYFNKNLIENNFWLGPTEHQPFGWNSNKWGFELDSTILPVPVLNF